MDDLLLRGRGPIFNVTLEPGEGGGVVALTLEALFDERYEDDEEELFVRIVAVSGGIIDPESREAVVTIVDGDSMCIHTYLSAVLLLLLTGVSSVPGNAEGKLPPNTV